MSKPIEARPAVEVTFVANPDGNSHADFVVGASGFQYSEVELMGIGRGSVIAGVGAVKEALSEAPRAERRTTVTVIADTIMTGLGSQTEPLIVER